MRVVTRTFMLALVALALVPSGARAQTSEQTCRKERLIAIGKAAQCQSGAIAKYCASTQKEEDIRTRVASIAKCDDKLIDGYKISARRSNYSACDSPEALAEAIAAVDGATQTMMRAAETSLAACLATPTPTPTPATPTPTPTPTPATPTPTPCAVVSNGKGGTYTDNCNGTVTDSTTGLVWEQKTDAGGVHDKDNTYTWSTGSPWNFDGTAATVFLATLNTAGVSYYGAPCFAGSCDWRLPTAVELAGRESEGTATGGIVDLTVAGCVDDGTVGSGAPCINAIFGPTASSYYWSSSTEAPGTPYYPAYVSGVYFSGGFVGGGYKPTSWVVRAVRSGP